MLKIDSGYKYYGETFLENITIELKDKESTAIIGPDADRNLLLIKLLSGMYSLDNGFHTFEGVEQKQLPNTFFCIPHVPLCKEFVTVKALIKHYILYYDLFDIKLMMKFLNKIEILLKNEVEKLSFSQIKLLYLAIAISSGAKWIFIENTFVNIEHKYVQLMKKYIKGHKNRRNFIMCGRNLDEFDGLITNVIILKDEACNYSLSLFDNFEKFSVSYKENPDQELVDKYQLVHYKSLARQAFVIVRKGYGMDYNFFLDSKPLIYDVVDFEINDLFYCIGEEQW